MTSLTCKMFFLWLHTPEALSIKCWCFKVFDPVIFSLLCYFPEYLTYDQQTPPHKSVKGINDLNMINGLDLIDIHRLWHPMQFQNTYFFQVHTEH